MIVNTDQVGRIWRQTSMEARPQTHQRLQLPFSRGFLFLIAFHSVGLEKL